MCALQLVHETFDGRSFGKELTMSVQTVGRKLVELCDQGKSA